MSNTFLYNDITQIILNFRIFKNYYKKMTEHKNIKKKQTKINHLKKNAKIQQNLNKITQQKNNHIKKSSKLN